MVKQLLFKKKSGRKLDMAGNSDILLLTFFKKIMKKTLSLLVIVTSLSISQANAKTEGSYLGFDILKNNAKVKSTSSAAFDNQGSNQPYYNHSKKDSSYGFGLNYKYAFNFNNFFIAPGISFDYLNNEVKSGYGVAGNQFSQSLKLKTALSLRANLGYDISDQFAFYVPVGISQFSYESKTNDEGSGRYIRTKKSANESAAFIGFGLSYEPIKNWVVNLEYNKYQNLKLNSTTATFNSGKIINKTDIDMMKLGLAYRF